MGEESRVIVYAIDDLDNTAPLAEGVMVESWLALLRPPLEALVEKNGNLPNGELRVRVLSDGSTSTAIEGNVSFNDPFDEGLLAAVDLDVDSPWPVQPILGAVRDERSAADAAYSLIASDPTGGPVDLALTGDSEEPAPGVFVDVSGASDWPPERPHGYPLGREYPPVTGQSRSLMCWLFPCCRGCPPNDRCTFPPPPDDPV